LLNSAMALPDRKSGLHSERLPSPQDNCGLLRIREK
jgi:hypothetical protein